ncbi:acriflavine sensitivity control acr-2 [Fusarium pseudocircinatum]|uniref:Acriflavine sensitivity control acr-2 n=1 Tax=Fusarium pseudocircinatum TaxID=56676 RepID=A0A8H5L0A5_9HYPO|nr:acriflavine sensitivity control acr-2 [Fusarium pseudocircinatum]
MEDGLFAPNSCYERKGKIVWANGMASRGKMMGKTTFETIEDDARGHETIAVYKTYPEAVEITYDTKIGCSILTLPVRRKDPAANEGGYLTDSSRFGILGNTLVPSDSLRVTPMLLDAGLRETLRRSEQQTWIGCPADLLALLHAMNSLRSVSDHSSHTNQTAILITDDLDHFSPRSWAQDFPDTQHHESRYHLAHAYKAAVSIYAYHAIKETLGQPLFPDIEVSRITDLGIFHMSQIPASDFHIKSLVWPAFVLGAEARGLHNREQVKDIMHNIWVSSCCYNVKTATGMLGKLWEWGRDNDSGKQSWLRFIWEQNESWLFL